jgi:RNA polymerase sigma factor (sigma-70 family)
MAGPDTMAALAARKPQFLGFLRARLDDERQAEDLLQAAYLRAMEKGGALRDDGSSVAWFYQLLRNALIDLHRARARGPGAAPLEALDDAELGVPPEQLHEAVCRCVEAVVDTLSPAHARLLRRVDLEGASVPAVAQEERITPNNAGVRLHRARAALRDRLRRVCGACSRHGCLDCHCSPHGGV